MIKDIGITQSEFGFGVGVLSAGYCLFRGAKYIALYKFGARVWLARIMITWGVISMAMMFAQGAFSFSDVALSARRSRGRVFPWRGLLSYLVVPRGVTRPHLCLVPDQHSGFHSRRGSDIERAASSSINGSGLQAGNGSSGSRDCRPSSSASCS